MYVDTIYSKSFIQMGYIFFQSYQMWQAIAQTSNELDICSNFSNFFEPIKFVTC